MKNACFALIGFLATAAFADLTPNTIIDNVPGDTTISNLVAASSVKSVEIDPTLSEEGKAADALKVKQALAAKQSDLGASVDDTYVVFPYGIKAVGGEVLAMWYEVIDTNAHGGLEAMGTSDDDPNAEHMHIRTFADSDRSLPSGDIVVPRKNGVMALTSDIPAPYTPPSYLRAYDEVRKCWWRGRMVNGVINWEVE